MKDPLRIWPLLLLIIFLMPSWCVAQTEGEEAVWEPTPPRVSFIDGEVSYWRTGAADWAAASINLPLADSDALYAGKDSNFEVQFGGRSFVRGDEYSELMFQGQEEGRLHFNVTSGRVSFDMRRLEDGKSVEVSTPDAAFLISDPGYYRVEVGNQDTHFITRHGGLATVTTADGLSLNILPSEDIVVTAGTPVKVATYVAPEPDAWDLWNDERTQRIGESLSERYLSPDIYGAEELDHYGHWRVVDTYGPVWIPDGVDASWAPYSTGYWVWDPYYEWTWVDDETWGWAPFHYGRWVYIDGYWAWAPGPVLRHSVYSPALVAFMTPSTQVSVNVVTGLPALWWVALWWGEPVVPWWQHHRFHGHPRWDGWGGPRIVNGREFRGRQVNVVDIRYHNSDQPHAIRTMPSDKFGRERRHAAEEDRFRSTDYAPVRGGELPIKPSRESLYGGAPRGIQPPQGIVSRPVVSIEKPRQPAVQPWQKPAPGTAPQKLPEVIYMVPPARGGHEEKRFLSRPPFGSEAGPELTPPPKPPRYDDVKRSMPRPVPPFTHATPGTPVLREQPNRQERIIRPPFSQPPVQQPGQVRQEQRQQPFVQQPGQVRQEPRQQPFVQPPGQIRQEQRQQPFVQPPGQIRQEQRQQPFVQQPGQMHQQQQRPLPGQPANQPHQRRFVQ